MNEWIKACLGALRSEPLFLLKLSAASGAVSWACWNWPLYFGDLIGVIQPVSLTIFIVSSLALFTGAFFYFFKAFWKSILKPQQERWGNFRRGRRLKRELLCLSILELIELSRALAETRRKLALNADSLVAITLVDRGVIRRLHRIDYVVSYEPIFEITEDAWRMMLGMKEFQLRDPSEVQRRAVNGARISSLVEVLPQSHPAVVSWVGEGNR